MVAIIYTRKACPLDCCYVIGEASLSGSAPFSLAAPR